MEHLTKDILTTKIAKVTKGSDIFDHKLRALRALRGQVCFVIFGCGPAALRSLRLNDLTPCTLNPDHSSLITVH
jgi:hypothetical protein